MSSWLPALFNSKLNNQNYLNFSHVSLCLCDQDVEKYKLGNPRTFHYLNQSNCYELDGVDDSKEYLSTRKAMDVVGIGSDEQVLFLISFLTGKIYMRNYTRISCSQDAIFRVVAAILHLGNVEFAKGKEIDSSEPKDDKSRFHLKTAAELFMYVILHHQWQ